MATPTSVSSTVKTDDEPASATPRANKGMLVALAVVATLAFAPLWALHAVRCWQSGIYQYVAPLLIAVAVLYRMRFPAAKTQASRPQMALVYACCIPVVALLLGGYLRHSGWLGMIATVCAAWLITYAYVGLTGLRVMWPVLLLLIFAIPLPFNWDVDLMLRVQVIASTLADWMLDGAGVMHLRRGATLLTENSTESAAAVFSGARSVFSSLAFVAVWSVAFNHRAARTILNLFQTVFWVLLGNAVRVIAVIYLATHVSDWYASGIGHSVVSIAIFAGILGMIASTDELISWFAERQLRLNWRGEEQIEIVDEATLATEMAPTRTGLATRLLKRSPSAKMGDADEMREGVNLPSIRGRKKSKFDEAMGDESTGLSALLSRSSSKFIAGILAVFLLIALAGWLLIDRQSENPPEVEQEIMTPTTSDKSR